MFTLGKYAVGILLLQILISFNEFNGISCVKSEGESCENSGKPGVCEVIEKCPILEKNLKDRKVSPENNWCGGFNAKKEILYCCTEIPVKLEVKTDPVNIPKKGSGGFVFPLNNTSITTQRSILSENADSSEHGNAIDTEFTSIKNPSRGIQQISSTETNNFDSVINNVFDNPVKSEALVAVTDYPIKNFATSTTTTIAQPLVLDAWMLEAIEQAKREAALLESTTTTTQSPTVRTTKSIVGYIDLSRKQSSSTTTSTTTTAAPLIVPPNQFQNKPNNVQTVWVIEEPSGGQVANNQQQGNWNRGRPNQNFNRPNNQQQTNNWNRQQQQQQQHPQQQNWNRPSDPIQVIVIEEEPNGRDTNFQNNRQNWNRPVNAGGSNFNSQTGVNGNFNQQQQFRTHHHTWNGNGFNQGRPNAQNHNVEFVQAFNSNGNNQNRQINGQIGQIQASSTISTLNPDNPFLKTVLNPPQPQNPQRSGQLIQLQPAWNNNNNNNPSFGFRRTEEDQFKNQDDDAEIIRQSANKIANMRPAEIECDRIKKKYAIKRLDQKIIEGKLAEIGEFPHMVALGYRKDGVDDIAYDCAGSLISEQYVLTAGHCVKTRTKLPIVARMGRNNIKILEVNDNEGSDIDIDNVTLHSSYRQASSYNDIALIRLKDPITESDYLHPACLYTKVDELDENLNLTITGWGTTNVQTRTTSSALLKAIVKPVLLNKCSDTLKSFVETDRALSRGIINTQLCANDEKSDTCQGDSGGPIQISDDTSISTVVGITSVGYGCGINIPGLYTRVASYLDWIEPIVWPNLKN